MENQRSSRIESCIGARSIPFSQVMALVTGGGYAEYVAVHMGCAMTIPSGVSMVDAAGQCTVDALARDGEETF